MKDNELLLNVANSISEQSEFIFDKLVTWFIFYCTLNLTALVSGYLSIIKNDEVKKKKPLYLMNQLLYWGSVAFYISTYVSIIGCLCVSYYFIHQKTKVAGLIEQINIEQLDNNLYTAQFYTFAFVTTLFVLILILFTIIWYRVRKKNNFENPLKVIFLKKPFKTK